MENSNIDILKRLIEIGKNQLEWNVQPRPFKDEHISLFLMVNSALKDAEKEFQEEFEKSVRFYKWTISESKSKYGWFNNLDNLLWCYCRLQQLRYLAGGDSSIFITLKISKGKAMYKKIIDQINCTVLMSPRQKSFHEKRTKKMLDEIFLEMQNEQIQEL